MFKTKKKFAAHVASLHRTTHPDIATLAEVFWDTYSDRASMYPRFVLPDAIALMLASSRHDIVVVDRTLEVALTCQSDGIRYMVAHLYWMHAWRTRDDALTADHCLLVAAQAFLTECRGYFLIKTLPFVIAATAYRPDTIDVPVFEHLQRIDLFAPPSDMT